MRNKVLLRDKLSYCAINSFIDLPNCLQNSTPSMYADDTNLTVVDFVRFEQILAPKIWIYIKS